MPKPRRNIAATAEETSSPPEILLPTQSIAKVIRATGNSLYACRLADGTELLVELPSRFRNTIWIKRGGFVLLERKDAEGRENKIGGEIVNVVRGEKEWRKRAYWPKEFVKVSAYAESDDEGPKMPSDDSDSD